MTEEIINENQSAIKVSKKKANTNQTTPLNVVKDFPNFYSAVASLKGSAVFASQERSKLAHESKPTRKDSHKGK